MIVQSEHSAKKKLRKRSLKFVMKMFESVGRNIKM